MLSASIMLGIEARLRDHCRQGFEPGHIDADLHGRAEILDRARDAGERCGVDRRVAGLNGDAVGADRHELAHAPGARHGGGQVRVDVHDVEIASLVDDDELLAVHDALDKLAAEDSKKAELAKLRYFVGMTFEEAAEVLGISVATAKRYWVYARAFLYEEMRANKTK